MSARSFNQAATSPPENQGEADAAVAAALARKERQAMDNFVHQYQDRLYSSVLRIVTNREDAADITQDTLTRAIQGIRRFTGQSSLYTWVFRIAVNESLTHLRRQRLHQSHAVRINAAAQPSAAAGDPAHDAATRLDYEVAIAALNHLSTEHRLLVVMRDIDGADYSEIASVTGLPVGTVKSRLFRARQALRHAIESSHRSASTETSHGQL